jgi:hypothetical protein
VDVSLYEHPKEEKIHGRGVQKLVELEQKGQRFERQRCLIRQRRMRPLAIVVLSKGFQTHARRDERTEQLHIQAFIPAPFR